MNLEGFLKEVAKVNIADPANRRWGWVASYVGECLGIPREQRPAKIRAMVCPEIVNQDDGIQEISSVECAILVVTNAASAEITLHTCSCMIADPVNKLSCALVVDAADISFPSLAGCVSAADERWSANLEALLGETSPRYVELDSPVSSDADLSGATEIALEDSAPVEEQALVLSGQGWLVGVEKSNIIGDLVAIQLACDVDTLDSLGMLSGDWLAIVRSDSTDAGVFCVARIAAFKAFSGATVVVLGESLLLESGAHIDCLDDSSYNFPSHAPVSLQISEISSILVANAIRDAEQLPTSFARLSSESVKRRLHPVEFSDRTIVACLSALASGRHLILRGRRGTGKTSLARALADCASDVGVASSIENLLEAEEDSYGSSGQRNFPPNPFDYRPPDYSQTDQVVASVGLLDAKWCIVDDLTSRRARDRVDQALKAAGDNTLGEWTRGRVVITTGMTMPELAQELGTAVMSRFAMLEVESPTTPTFWHHLVEKFGHGLPSVARDQLRNLAVTDGLTPGRVVELASQLRCMLVTNDVVDDDLDWALPLMMQTYSENGSM